MEFRQARADELIYLKYRLNKTDHEQIDLDRARVFVADQDGTLRGMLCLRLVWQAEPLLIFDEVEKKSERRRAGYGMYRAALKWLSSTENRTGIRWLFGITRSAAVERWLLKLGWLRQYVGAKTFIKYV